MALVNEHLLKLPNNHFLLNMEKKINTFKVTHPKAHLISLGTGDVTRPLPQASIDTMHKAIDEMGCIDSFHGYAPEQGYSFLTEAILKHDYAARGVSLEPGEIFINDGTKREVGDIGDLLRHDNSIGVTTPICPKYIVANVTYGRAGTPQPDGTWSNVVYLPCLPENNFIPQIPSQRIDIIYLSFPNNPTGAVITKNELKKWVNYAIANDTLIMYDAAYEAYIQDPDLPHSIYEIKGAKKVAIDEGCRDDIKPELVDRVILKELKTVKEQIDTCPASREDLKAEYQFRYDVISEYAPKQMSADEVKAYIKEKFADVLATKSKGAIMKAVMADMKGKADGKVINQTVAELCK